METRQDATRRKQCKIKENKKKQDNGAKWKKKKLNESVSFFFK